MAKNKASNGVDLQTMQGVMEQYEFFCTQAMRDPATRAEEFKSKAGRPYLTQAEDVMEQIYEFSHKLRQSLAAHNENGYIAADLMEQALNIRQKILARPEVQGVDEITQYHNHVVVLPTGDNVQTSLFKTNDLHNDVNYRISKKAKAEASEPKAELKEPSFY